LVPDIGEGGGEVDDKGPAEEGRAAVCCHVEELEICECFVSFSPLSLRNQL
jgi:hypothetical protein